MGMSGKKGLRRLCGLLALLWLAFIWGRSLQPAAISSQESGAVLNGLTELLRALGLPALLDMTMVSTPSWPCWAMAAGSGWSGASPGGWRGCSSCAWGAL